MTQLIVNYSLTGIKIFENKAKTFDIDCLPNNIDDLHKEVLAAVCLFEKVNSEQIRITGIMKVK